MHDAGPEAGSYGLRQWEISMPLPTLEKHQDLQSRFMTLTCTGRPLRAVIVATDDVTPPAPSQQPVGTIRSDPAGKQSIPIGTARPSISHLLGARFFPQ
jgi:hypothetical protein